MRVSLARHRAGGPYSFRARGGIPRELFKILCTNSEKTRKKSNPRWYGLPLTRCVSVSLRLDSGRRIPAHTRRPPLRRRRDADEKFPLNASFARDFWGASPDGRSFCALLAVSFSPRVLRYATSWGGLGRDSVEGAMVLCSVATVDGRSWGRGGAVHFSRLVSNSLSWPVSPPPAGAPCVCCCFKDPRLGCAF